MKILVIGESCEDVFHYGRSLRLCPEAPVPVFNSIEIIKNGGMAMNVYNNLKAMGVSVEILTNDNWKDIKKTRFIDKRSNHMFMRLDENDNSYTKCDLSKINFSDYVAVIVSDYNKGFLDKETIKQISLSHNLTFLDTKKLLGDWCENFSYIKINNIEYINSKELLTNKIIERLIVTKGPKGCLYRDEFYPVPLVEVKDTSGAGDTFISALCLEFVMTNNIDKSIEFANECATKVVQKKGVATV